jgi:hypothetical protein
MYSLSDHYLFSETITYDKDGEVLEKSNTAYDLTQIYILIIVLVFFVIINDIARKILSKVKSAVEQKKSKKKITYDTFA